jgi:hypothetical protein
VRSGRRARRIRRGAALGAVAALVVVAGVLAAALVQAQRAESVAQARALVAEGRRLGSLGQVYSEHALYDAVALEHPELVPDPRGFGAQGLQAELLAELDSKILELEPVAGGVVVVDAQPQRRVRARRRHAGVRAQPRGPGLRRPGPAAAGVGPGRTPADLVSGWLPAGERHLARRRTAAQRGPGGAPVAGRRGRQPAGPALQPRWLGGACGALGARQSAAVCRDRPAAGHGRESGRVGPAARPRHARRGWWSSPLARSC